MPAEKLSFNFGPGCKIPSAPQTGLKYLGNNEAAVSCERFLHETPLRSTTFSPRESERVDQTPGRTEKAEQKRLNGPQARHLPHLQGYERRLCQPQTFSEKKKQQKSTYFKPLGRKTKGANPEPVLRHACTSTWINISVSVLHTAINLKDDCTWR